MNSGDPEPVLAADPSQRIVALDAIRGVAVMGILAMNIVVFAMPDVAYFLPAVGSSASIGDTISWTISFILFDGKMRGLFSLLFGASIMLMITRGHAQQVKTSGSPGALHLRRMGWLAVFGLVHFYLIWWGDILFLYAVAGTVAFAFRKLDGAALVTAALLIYTVNTAFMALTMGALYGLEYAAGQPGASATAVNEYAGIMAELTGGYAQQIALYKSGYAEIVQYRLTEQFWFPAEMIAQNIGETLPFMLIGMALMKAQFGSPDRSLRAYWRWAKIGLGIGGLGYALLALAAYRSNFDVITIYNITIAWSMPFRLPMAMGYAALIVLLIARAQDNDSDTSGVICSIVSKLVARISAAGRTAFTNYIGTSIVMTSIFYGYGFGLFGDVSRSALWLFVAAGCALMLLWPKWWLARYRYGPLEWLWRSLARGEWQRMQR